MISTFSVNFALKKTKISANGTAPIYFWLTIEGNRIEFTTSRYINPAKWNAVSQKMTGTHEEARSFNQYLKTLEQQVYDAHRQMIESKVPVTVQSLKDKLFGKEEKPGIKMLVPIFKEHNRRIAAMVGRDYAAGTLQRYTTSLKHTIEFMQWQYQVADIDIKKVDHEFVSSYEFFLRSEKNCCNNTTVKYLNNFRKIIRICLSNHWLDKDPFAGYKARLNEVVPAYLTPQELQAISGKQFVSERINQVRDIFLLSCYTGLAYVDVKKLKRSEIVTGFDWQQCISTSRQKTDTASKIPLLPVALEIMNRYENQPQCGYEGRLLHVLSNQKMNGYLKEIGDICGIIPIESVSKMLGHKSIKTTQHYAKILGSKVSEDMNLLRQKMAKL